jgi:glycerol dehydrogenase-like iron-containing ADH family enzyme
MGILHTFLSPRRYMQGTGALAEVGTLVQPLGEHAFVLYDRGVAEL